jgi:hypothetical protein
VSTKAKLYLSLNILLGSVVVASCLPGAWQCPNPRRYAAYLMLALLASMLKVRLPGLTGTISLNFLFVLIGFLDFTLPETVFMASGGALVQCLWKSRRRPSMVQLMFNMAVLATSVALTHRIVRLLLTGMAIHYLPVLLGIGATVYFFSNTLLVSGVLSLVEHRRLPEVWQRCYLWTFPYYVVGAAAAGLISISSRTLGWQIPLMLLPATYLVFMFYRQCVHRLVRTV